MISRELDKKVQELLHAKAFASFEASLLEYLAALSASILRTNASRKYSDLASFAFFIRRANLKILQRKYFSEANDPYMGLGLAFHIAPGNVPLNFAYSLVVALLSGNPSVVKLPSKMFPQIEALIDAMFDTPGFDKQSSRFCFVQYSHENDLKDIISKNSRIRLIWGGDQTIAIYKKLTTLPQCLDITFPNKYSVGLIDASEFSSLTDVDNLARKLYDDIFPFDQNACSSPRAIFWYNENQCKLDIKELFYKKMSELVLSNGYQASLESSYRHFNRLSELAAIGLITSHKKYSCNIVTVGELIPAAKGIFSNHPGEGLFLNMSITSLEHFINLLDEECQTVATNLRYPSRLVSLIKDTGARGVDRICQFGTTSQFSPIWDGKDLISMMRKKLI